MSYTVGGGALRFDVDDAALQSKLRRAVDDAGDGAVVSLLEVLDPIAASARDRWYQLVDKDTGKTGDIQTAVTARGEVCVVEIGSTRLDRDVGGAPIAQVVRTPGPESRINIIQDASAALPAEGRRESRLPGGRKVVVSIPNPRRNSVSQSVLSVLVLEPSKISFAAALPEIRAAIDRRLGGG